MTTSLTNVHDNLFEDAGQFSALKVFKHLDTVSNIKNGKTAYPISIDLSVTNACNQRCVWCYYEDYITTTRVSLSREVVEELIEELSSLGVKGINFTGGGEPLVHPNLVDLMEFAARLGIDVGLITNGALLSEDKIKRLSKIAKYVRISLSSSNSESYMKYHKAKKGEFEKVIENLNILGRYSNDTECTSGVLSLFETRTQSELVSTAELVKNTGVDFIEIRSIKTTNTFKPEPLEIEKDREIYRQAKQFETDTFNVIIREELMRVGEEYGKPYKTCYLKDLATAISAEGDVYICCEFVGNKDYAYGNIKNKKFKEIWSSYEREDNVNRLNLDKCFSCCKGDSVNKLLNAVDETAHTNFI